MISFIHSFVYLFGYLFSIAKLPNFLCFTHFLSFFGDCQKSDAVKCPYKESRGRTTPLVFHGRTQVCLQREGDVIERGFNVIDANPINVFS